MTESQEHRQQHSGIGFIDATVRGCLEGMPLVINKSSLVFFNESPFDATPEKWMIETHCGSLPIAVTTSVMSIHSLANAGSKDDLQKICMYVQQEARNYLYDKWQHGGDIQGIEKKKEPTREVRPEIPTTDWKLMKVMDHCLVPLQSTIDKYSTTKHAAELQAILAKNTEQYNPEGKIHNDTTRVSKRPTAPIPLEDLVPTDPKLPKIAAGDEPKTLEEAKRKYKGEWHTIQVNDTLKVHVKPEMPEHPVVAFLESTVDQLLNPSVLLGGFGSGRWEMDKKAQHALQNPNTKLYGWQMVSSATRVVLGIDGETDLVAGALPVGPTTLQNYLSFLYSNGDVGFNILGHKITRNETEFKVEPTTKVVYVMKGNNAEEDGGAEKARSSLTLNNWGKVLQISKLPETALELVMKLKYERRRREITPGKGWLYLTNPVMLRPKQLLRIVRGLLQTHKLSVPSKNRDRFGLVHCLLFLFEL